MMKKISNRIISLILALVILSVSLPASILLSANEFEPVNILRTEHLESVNGGIYYTWASGEVVDSKTGTFYTDTRINGAGALDGSIDGDTTNNKDIWAYDYNNGNENLVVARYHLDDVYYCGKLVLFAGDSSKDAYFRVYASETLDEMYTDSANLVTATAICTGSPVNVEINRKVKYISVIYDANATIANYHSEVSNKNSIKDTRLAEVQLWTAEEPKAFVPENIFRTEHLESVNGGIFYSWANGEVVDDNTGTFYVDNRINGAGALDASVDGVISESKDIWAYDYNNGNENLLVARYHLDDIYYCGKLVMYAGDTSKDAYFRVYASDTLEDLYTDSANLVKIDVICKGASVDVEINRAIKYIAIVYDANATIANYHTEVSNKNSIKDSRIAEFQLWTAEEPKAFVPENIFRTEHLESVNGGIYYTWANGEVVDDNTGTFYVESRVNAAGALDASVDGILTESKDIWAFDYNNGNENLLVARYHLDDVYYCGKLVLYAGSASKNDIYRVYASDTLEDLYTDFANTVSTNVVCNGSEVIVEINREVKYIAIVYDANATIASYPEVTNKNSIKDSRIYEFQLWTAEKPEDDGSGLLTKKVLTIGNSFAENASAYATEIAAAQNFSLTFGYLKYPSATIEQHYNNAVNNSAEYKFALTENNGSIVNKTVKDGTNEKATIKEALEYTDWDYVAIQQGSTASYDYSTYEKADELIAYIKSVCPNTRVIIHETWSWATWAKDDNPDNNFKKIEDCYHQLSKDNESIRIIPSGRAFEFARRDGINVNEADTQHANAYGKYLAGACYVGRIFGANINQNTFGDNNPDFADVDMTKLRAAVVNALNFQYNSATNWDWADGLDEDEDAADPDSPNFIKRHFKSASPCLQDRASGQFQDGNRFIEANADGLKMAIDGDLENYFLVHNALDWEYPKNIGAVYKLNASYVVDEAVIFAGTSSAVTTFDVYASDSVGTLYLDESVVAKGVKCDGSEIKVNVGRQISCIAFVISDFTEGTSAQIYEFDLIGSDTPIIKEEIVWPEVPAGDNILQGATPYKIIAPAGDYKGSKEYEYRLMDSKDEVNLPVLTDGITDKFYDIWSLGEKDRPGVLYDLGGYYDLTHLHAWAGIEGSEILINNGYKIYASANLDDLYKDKSLAFDYINKDDITNEAAADVNIKRVRYVAFILANSSDGGWRMREFAAYGTKSADQTEVKGPTSIIEGIEAEYYGVATDNLADPIYNGASDSVAALTDGKRENIEFWGGADIENTTFVFIYNLYANYDLTGVDVYALADAIEGETGDHKGIRSAKVYASRTFDTLFTGTPIVMKDGYVFENEPDENSFFSATAPSNWKNIRYIAYVFKIGDTRYGACRLEELKAFGSLSAVQDPEPEEVKLPQYIDVKAANGVIARIFALNATDDLTKLGANLNSERTTAEKELSFINKALEGYKAKSLYSMDIVDIDGKSIDTDGRFIRLSIPKEKDGEFVACVDDFGAEIVSNGTLNEFLTVETSTLRSYALVDKTGGAPAGAGASENGNGALWAVVIALGVLAAAGIGLSAFFGFKLRKN